MPAQPCRLSTRRALPVRRWRVAAVALLLGAADLVGGPGVPVATAAPEPAGASKVATSSAACRTVVTVARPDRSLAVGVVADTHDTLTPLGVSLAYDPVAFAFIGSSTNRGVTIDKFLATDEGGRLHGVVITTRGGAASLDDEVLARSWQGVRWLVTGRRYLYGLTTTGALRRYTVGADLAVASAGVVAASGWGTVTSLSYAGWWKMPKGGPADDLIGASSTGRLSAYVVPEADPTDVSSDVLNRGRWDRYAHVAVGECPAGSARALVGVQPDGSVDAFVDADADDQSGGDIRSLGRVATGWTGTIAD